MTRIVACTLGALDLAEQSRRWGELRRSAEVGQRRTPTGKRVSFRDDEGVALELEQLVGVEQECCSWADWSIERIDGELVLDVSSSGEGISALHAMFSPGER